MLTQKRMEESDMKKRWIACGMVLAMAAGLIGCASGTTAENAEGNLKETENAVEIKMAVWSSGASDIYAAGAESFNASQDKIKLSVEMQSGDYNQYLGAKTAAKDLPDLFYVSSYSQVYEFAENGLLQDLSDRPFVDKIYDQAREAVTYDGKVYGFPEVYEWWGIIYNQELFKKAEIEKVPETFDEMKEVCEKLQAADITPFTAIYKDNWTLNQEFCALMGGVLGDSDEISGWIEEMNSGKGSFQVDGIDRVFEFMDLMKENSGKNFMDSDSSTGFYAFANQEAAMMFLSDAAMISVGSVSTELPLGFFAVPVTDHAEDAQVVAGPTNAIVVNKNSKHLEEALEVLDYLSDGEEGWLKVFTGYYGAPLACMDFEPVEDIADKQYFKDLKAYVDEGKTRSTLFNELVNGASDIMGEQVQGYFADLSDKDTLIDNLDKEFKELVESKK